jgi:catechol 2,3-dioxygenase-like lactoylglutathione lyase family enzyme
MNRDLRSSHETEVFAQGANVCCWGVEQTWLEIAATSEFDPEQTFGPSSLNRLFSVVLAVIKLTKYYNSVIAEDGLMEINGVAHTFITAGDFAAARAFYGQLLPFLGLTVVADSVNTFYCVGGRTGFGIHGAAAEFAGQRFRQGTVGLHHHCFRARERGDVDEAYNFLVKIGAKIIHEPREDGFAPGYYSVLFEDPDGTRLEINHVPGKGLLAPGMQIGGGYNDGTQNG